jgi:protein FAM50
MTVRRLDDRRKKKKKKASAAAAKLSFADDDEDPDGGAEEEDGANGRFGKLGKNPAVKTDFLPDRERELEDAKESIRLKEEYRAAMKAKLESSFDLHFLYWQSRGVLGQDVRKIKCVMSVKYGDSVGDLLNRFRDEHHREHTELAHLTGEQCMFAKEGLIVPGHHTWFELISRGCVVLDKDVFKDLDAPSVRHGRGEEEEGGWDRRGEGVDEAVLVFGRRVRDGPKVVRSKRKDVSDVQVGGVQPAEGLPDRVRGRRGAVGGQHRARLVS